MSVDDGSSWFEHHDGIEWARSKRIKETTHIVSERNPLLMPHHITNLMRSGGLRSGVVVRDERGFVAKPAEPLFRRWAVSRLCIGCGSRTDRLLQLDCGKFHLKRLGSLSCDGEMCNAMG